MIIYICLCILIALLSVMQTKKIVASSIAYAVVGRLYPCLLYLSRTPDTIRLMFASRNWLPEVCFKLVGNFTLISKEKIEVLD